MLRGRGVVGIEPCLDYTFDILLGDYEFPSVFPRLQPREGFLTIACGGSLTNVGITENSRHSFYRTNNLVTNRAYFARFINTTLTDTGYYCFCLGSVHGFSPYVTVHRSTAIQWQGVPDGDGIFEFTVGAGQTGPATIEVSTLNRYETGSFSATLTCPGDTVTIHYDGYVGTVGWPHRFISNQNNADDTPMGSVPDDVYQFDLASPVEWSIIAGSLAPGLVLDAATGDLVGTPTTVGDYPFTVRLKKNGIIRGTQSFTTSVRNPVTIQNVAALKTWIEAFGNPIASMDGVLRAIGGSADPESTWRWEGKGFHSGGPAGYRGITYTINFDTPRTIYIFSYAFDFNLVYTKTDMLSTPLGVYGSPNDVSAPATLTIV